MPPHFPDASCQSNHLSTTEASVPGCEERITNLNDDVPMLLDDRPNPTKLLFKVFVCLPTIETKIAAKPKRLPNLRLCKCHHDTHIPIGGFCNSILCAFAVSSSGGFANTSISREIISIGTLPGRHCGGWQKHIGIPRLTSLPMHFHPSEFR